MKFISFVKVNKKFLIPLMGGIITLIIKYPINLNPKIDIISQNPFILNIYISIGMILAFVPYLILNYRIKKPKIKSNESQNKSKLNVELIAKDDYIFHKTKFNKYKLIFLSTIFDFTQTLLATIYCSGCVYNLWIFDIIFINIFSYFILKTKLYKHQYFSIIIIIILGLILNIIEYFKFDEEEKINIFEIIMKFISEICLSFSIVISKYNI